MRSTITRFWTLVATLGAVITVGTAGVQAAPPTPSVRTSTTTMTLETLSPWVKRIDTVTAVVRVSHAPSGSTLHTVLHRGVTTRSGFALTMAGENLRGSISDLSGHPLSGSTSSVTVRFRVEDGSSPPEGVADPSSDGSTDPGADTLTDSVTLTESGVYPLRFAVTDSEGNEIASLVSYIVRLPTATPDGATSRRPLAVASEFRLQPEPVMDASGKLIASPTARLMTGALVDGLGDTPQGVRNSFGFAVSPSLLDALGRSGEVESGTGDPSADVADRSNLELLDGLADLTDGLPLQSQPWSPLDPATWLATGDLAPLVDTATTHGDDALGQRLHPVEPSVTDLDAWGGRISDASLRWFADRRTIAFLVPDDALEPLDSDAFPRSLAAPFLLDIGDDRTTTALQLDSQLAAHFNEADPVLGANQLVADLAVIALDLPSISRGLVVAPPRGWKPSAAFLSAYATALASAHPEGSDALVAPTPLTEVVHGTPPARAAGDTATEGAVLQRALRQGRSPAPATALGAQVTLTGSFVDSFEGMAPGGAAKSHAIATGFREQIALSAMPDVSTALRNRRFAAIRTTIDESARSLRLPPRQTITLTADTASLPITIRRPAKGPTRVLIHIDAPDRLHFPNGRTQAVRLDDTTNRFELRVHSDSPGDTIVRLTVTSPDSKLVSGTTEIVVRSTAASGVGLVISFGSLAFLIIWWVRDIIRTRRRHRAQRVPPAELIDIDRLDPDKG